MFYIRVTEEECRELPERIAMRAAILDDSYYPDDPVFMSIYKANRETKKKLDNYLFDKRHKL